MGWRAYGTFDKRHRAANVDFRYLTERAQAVLHDLTIEIPLTVINKKLLSVDILGLQILKTKYKKEKAILRVISHRK